MKKEMYDSSIHLGQFSLDEGIRVRCKNAQVRIVGKDGVADKNTDEVVGVVTFVENTESDHLIRETLGRKEQDVFYPRMDVRHSVKKVEKVRDSDSKAKRLAVEIEDKYKCNGSSSNIIAAAILSGCDIIYTLYKNLLEHSLVEGIKSKYGIIISIPPIGEELTYSGGQIQEEDGKEFNLEDLYRDAMSLYSERNIDLLENLLSLQENELGVLS